MNDELMERLARALANSQARDDEGEYERLADLIGFSGENKLWTVLRAAVQAILSELSAAGYPPVPELPTQEMLDAAREAREPERSIDLNSCLTWAAMIRARPV